MRKILIRVGILAIIMVGAYLGFSFYAVKLIQPKIQKAIGPEVTLSDIKFRITHLSIKKIQYEEQRSKKRIFQMEEIRIYPSLLSLLMGHLRIKELVIHRPSFFFFRSREGNLLIPWRGINEREGQGADFGEKKKKVHLPLKIDQVRVQGGSIDFEDRRIGDPPAQLNLRELDIRIRGVEYPLVSTPFPFKLNGKVGGLKSEGSIKIEGWLDPRSFEFESILNIREIGVKIFEPYYRKKISAGLEDGLIHIEAKVVLKRRILDIQGDMELVGLQIRGGEGRVFWIPANVFSTQLKKTKGRLKIPFHIKGDLNDPKFNLQESMLIGLATSLAESLGMPIKIFGEEK